MAKEKGHAECERVIEEHAAAEAVEAAEAREAERAAAEAEAARHAEGPLAERIPLSLGTSSPETGSTRR